MQHSEYGGSNCDRWLNCPGSVSLLRRVPRREAGYAAQEGTALHAIMEMLLADEGLAPAKFLGTTVCDVTIDKDMADRVGVALEAYLDVLDEYSEDATVYSEKRVELTPEAYGTADVVVVDGTLGAIVDFKFGQSLVTADTEQALFYAAAARKTVPGFDKVERIACYIIQPAMDPAIDMVMYDAQTIEAFEISLLAAIKASKAPDPAYKPGDWCGWCDAKVACPAKTGALVELNHNIRNSALDLNDLARFLAIYKDLTTWAAAAEERLHTELSHGTKVAGWKLVAKRAIRAWIDDNATIARFKALKIPETKFMVSKLISPAQAEKVVPKDVVAALANGVSSGTTIAPEDDKRPAVLPTGALANTLKRLS